MENRDEERQLMTSQYGHGVLLLSFPPPNTPCMRWPLRSQLGSKIFGEGAPRPPAGQNRHGTAPKSRGGGARVGGDKL